MDPATDSVETDTLGSILAVERERQGLSRLELAQRLHMSMSQVEALESGDYSRLPQGTFLRGFVRNYAKALGLDPESAVAHLAQAAPRAPAPGIVVPSQNIRFDPLGERLASPYLKAVVLAVFALAVGFAAMYWWLFIRPQPPAAAAAKKAANPAPRNLAQAPVAPPEPVVMQQAPIVTEEPKVEPVKAEAPVNAASAKPEVPKAPAKAQPPSQPAARAPVETAKATPPPQAAGSTLRFRFKGSSWVEIKDGRGKVLLSKLNAPGSETEVSGRPPFTVVVGNAPEVEMTYNDRDFPLEPHTRVAVARFTVD